jgi:hypothetical protein
MAASSCDAITMGMADVLEAVMAEREPGFYWVDLKTAPTHTEWTLAQWTGSGWWAIGINERLRADQFAEIGERVERGRPR